jgi:hypothetical protein
VFVANYTEAQARAAVAASLSYAETLRRLGLCATGGNGRTLKIWIDRWEIETQHFDPRAAQRKGLRRKPRPLDEILVEGSGYSRNHLKERLYREGLKPRRCELCGQDDQWRGLPMSLILDHVNGVRDDHRLDNLRIVCPNCAATLETHCGRKNRTLPVERACLRCGRTFRAKYRRQRYCSRDCGIRAPGKRGEAQPALRRIGRPPYAQLMREIDATSYSAVGRRYGVSDNAIRKWVRQYAREAAAGEVGRAGSSPAADAREADASRLAREGSR